MGRNLSTDFAPATLDLLRSSLAAACTRPQHLQEVLCPQGGHLPRAGPCEAPQALQQTRHWELPDLEHGELCAVCGASFEGDWLLRQHQADTGHFNSEDPAELSASREYDVLERSQALQRVEMAINED